MARDLVSGEDNVLSFSHIVECPHCGCEQEGIFRATGQELQDIKEVADAVLICEDCGERFNAPYEGYQQYGYS